MARIVIAAHVVRSPLGGYFSWILQWVLGFYRLGHDVYVVERAGWPKSCYNPAIGAMTDDPSYGVAAWSQVLGRFGLNDRWCYADLSDHYHGMPAAAVAEVFRTADVFIDLTADAFGNAARTWAELAQGARTRVFIDGEPGYYQARIESYMKAGRPLPEYDHYYSVGLSVGLPGCTVPTAGKAWVGIPYPFVPDLLPAVPPPAGAPFTTVMSWQAHNPETFSVSGYGQKDIEFKKFASLPSLTSVGLEVAVGGDDVPFDWLRAQGWRTRQAESVTRTLDAFYDYIAGSMGEFTVCKNLFVATNSGWFSDRSAAYLGCGRPVVMQETGFSAHLPCGRGLFAVRTVDDAAAALEAIVSDYTMHSRAAREVAAAFLSTDVVLRRLLDQVAHRPTPS